MHTIMCTLIYWLKCGPINKSNTIIRQNSKWGITLIWK